MADLLNQPYHLNRKMEAPGPLGRFLPSLADGPAQSFLAELNIPGAWVLDPFGASPRLAVEMARSGQRILVSAGNPFAGGAVADDRHPVPACFFSVLFARFDLPQSLPSHLSEDREVD